MAGTFGNTDEDKTSVDLSLPSFTEFTSTLRTGTDYFDPFRHLTTVPSQVEGYSYWSPPKTKSGRETAVGDVPPSIQFLWEFQPKSSTTNQLYRHVSNDGQQLDQTHQYIVSCGQKAQSPLESNPFFSGLSKSPVYVQNSRPPCQIPDVQLCVPGTFSEYLQATDYCVNSNDIQNGTDQQQNSVQQAGQSHIQSSDLALGTDIGTEFWTKELCSLFDILPPEPDILQNCTASQTQAFKETTFNTDSIGDYRNNPCDREMPAVTASNMKPNYCQTSSHFVPLTSSADVTSLWLDKSSPAMSDSGLNSEADSCGVTSSTDQNDDPLLTVPALSSENVAVDQVSSTSESAESKNKNNFKITKASRRAADEPRRPKNSFIRFSVENRRRISEEHPTVDNREISKILGTLWKNLTPEQKKPYEMEFSKDMETIKMENPNWQYVPNSRLAADLVEPMPHRLRPRNCLKKKEYSLKIYGKRQTATKEIQKSSTRYRKSKTSRFTRMKRVVQTTRANEQTPDLPAQDVQTWVQCDVCFKWRRLPNPVRPSELPDYWLCELNPDPDHRSCFVPQEQ